MRLSLRTKFSGLVLGLILVMMLSIWLLSINEQSNMEKDIARQESVTMQEELTKRARNIFSFLAANSDSLAREDYLTVDVFVREILLASDIRFVHIVRNGHLVVPMSESGAPPEYHLPDGVKPAERNVRIDLITAPDGEALLVASGPIIDKSINVRVAEAYVGISRHPIDQAVAAAQTRVQESGKTARYNITYATAIFAILGVLCAVVLVTYVVRPIRILARGAKIIGEGNLDHVVDVRTNDEVGDLARTFNVMTRNLKEDQVQLVEKEKLDQELKIAMQIQQTLLPKTLPAVPGYNFGAVYTAARQVGGDYYDFMDVQTRGHPYIAVVVADVSGKGVPGAFVMAVARSILRSHALSAESPAEVLKSTNSILHPDMKKGMFVSMFYGLLDLKTGCMDISNAGHNPTLVYRAESQSIESVRCKGMALGIGDPDVFDRLIETKQIVLQPGDIFFQYTDGIQHAMNAGGDRFGMDRVLECLRQNTRLAAQGIVDKVMDRVITFCAGAPQFDDITMVAVKRVRVGMES